MDGDGREERGGGAPGPAIHFDGGALGPASHFDAQKSHNIDCSLYTPTIV